MPLGMSTAFVLLALPLGRYQYLGSCLGHRSSRISQQRGPRKIRHARVTACALSSDLNLSGLFEDVRKSGADVSSVFSDESVNRKTRRGLTIPTSAQEILKGTELLSVPSALVLTPNSARKHLEIELPSIKSLLSTLSDSALLALTVCLEHSNADSPFALMLKALPSPEVLNSVVLWTDPEVAILHGSPVSESVKRVQEGVRAEHSQILAAFGSNDDVSWLSLERYKWAIAVVDCCAAPTLEGDLALAPLLHFCTTAPPGNSGNISAQFTGGMFFSPKRLVLKSEENVKPGSKLLFDGELGGNADSLLERGEAYESEEYHCAELSFELATLDRFFEDKNDILEQVGLQPRNTFRFTANTDGKWDAPENLEAFLRLLCLQGTDSFLLEPVFSGSIWSFMQLPVSEENEKAVYDLIIGACEDALDEYGTACETDATSISPERRRLASIVIEGERRVLSDTKAYYKKQLLSLGVLEYYAERRLKELDLLRPVEDSEIVDGGATGFRIPQPSDDSYR